MFTPQDGETFLEAIFRSKNRLVWHFTLQKRQYYAWESHYRQNVFSSRKCETEEW